MSNFNVDAVFGDHLKSMGDNVAKMREALYTEILFPDGKLRPGVTNAQARAFLDKLKEAKQMFATCHEELDDIEPLVQEQRESVASTRDLMLEMEQKYTTPLPSLLRDMYGLPPVKDTSKEDALFGQKLAMAGDDMTKLNVLIDAEVFHPGTSRTRPGISSAKVKMASVAVSKARAKIGPISE